MNGMVGGVGGVGGIGGVGMGGGGAIGGGGGAIGGGGGAIGGGAIGGGASSPATAASPAALSGGNAPASSPDVTVNISSTAKAALAADSGQSSITINVPHGNSTLELQNILGQNEWDKLVADLLLALLLQQMQNK